MVSENIQSEIDEQLCGYELIVVVSPETSEEGLEAVVESISQYVTENGGAISEVNRWGKRRLAYPIDRFVEGNYILTRFQLKPEHNLELETNLRISEDIIRHLLIRRS